MALRSGVSHWNGSAVEHYVRARGTAAVPVRVIHVDRGGTVWIGTVGFGSGGLARIEGTGPHFYTPAGGFTGRGVHSITEDHAGNVWIGCVDGLYRWDGRNFHRNEANISVQRIGGIAETSDGSIIVGTYGGDGLKRLAGGVYEDYPVGKFGPKVSTRVLLRDSDGGLWIGTHGRGLIHTHKGSVDQFTHVDGLSGNSVLDLFEDREGNVWVATERGLDRFRALLVTILAKREGLSDDD